MINKKYTIILTILFTISASNVFSNPPKIAIWPDLAPGTKNQPNSEKWEGQNKVTKVYQPDLTTFLLKNSPGKHPTLLIFPGGGYRQVVINKEGYKIAHWANQNNMNAFVLKYRLQPESALRDAQRAMGFLRANASTYNIDKNRIGVIGFSAGAHLAANLTQNHDSHKKSDAVDNESSRPDFMVGVYSGYPNVFGPLGNFKVKKDFAPTFLVHSGKDNKADVFGSIELYSKLNKMHIPAELHIYEHGGHGFALETDRGSAITSTVNAWSRRCIEWLEINNILQRQL